VSWAMTHGNGTDVRSVTRQFERTDERGIQLPPTNWRWQVAKSRIRTRIRLMKPASLLYVVAGSLSIRLRFIHGIKDFIISMMDQKFRRLCRSPMSVRLKSLCSDHMNICLLLHYCINLGTKTILIYCALLCCNVINSLFFPVAFVTAVLP